MAMLHNDWNICLFCFICGLLSINNRHFLLSRIQKAETNHGISANPQAPLYLERDSGIANMAIPNRLLKNFKSSGVKSLSDVEFIIRTMIIKASTPYTIDATAKRTAHGFCNKII